MIKKIISGGQTGADRAALDVALAFSIPHGGWVPRGRKAGATHQSKKTRGLGRIHLSGMKNFGMIYWQRQ